MSIEVSINMVDRASPQLLALQAKLTPRQLGATVGPAVRECVRDHLVSLGPNKRGWPSTRFHERAARATRWEPDPAGARIIVNQIGARQRFHGGPIAPVNKQALTIPISPLSYGKTVADFPGAFPIKTPKGAYIVQYADGGFTKGQSRHGPSNRATLNFLFKLSPGVDQLPNPDFLPPWPVMGSVAVRAIKARVLGKELS